MTDHATPSNLAVLTSFLEAIEAGDIDQVRAIYHPDAVVWHNNDLIEQTVEQNLAVLQWMTTNITGFRYEEIRREATATGAVEQHITVMPLPNGEEIRMPACIVVQINDSGQITRLDEYIDGVQVGQLQQAMLGG